MCLSYMRTTVIPLFLSLLVFFSRENDALFFPTGTYNELKGFQTILGYTAEDLPIGDDYYTWLLRYGREKKTKQLYIHDILHKHLSPNSYTPCNYHDTIDHITRVIDRALTYCTAKTLFGQTEHKSTDIHKLKQSYIRNNIRYKGAPCGSLDHFVINDPYRILDRDEPMYEITVDRYFDIVLTIHTFVGVHTILREYEDDGLQCTNNMLMLTYRRFEHFTVCGSRHPTTYHLSTSTVELRLRDGYNVVNTYLSIAYQIKHSWKTVHTHHQYINVNASMINKHISFAIRDSIDGLTNYFDLFVFNVIAHLLETVNIYLYRVQNCTLRYELYKVLEGPMTVLDSTLCDNPSRAGPTKLYANPNETKEMFLKYEGKSSYIKVNYFTFIWFSGYAFHFTFNASSINAVPVNISHNKPTHWITVNTSGEKIYHKAWHLSSDTFLVISMMTLRRFDGLDGGCFYGGFAIRQLALDEVKERSMYNYLIQFRPCIVAHLNMSQLS